MRISKFLETQEAGDDITCALDGLVLDDDDHCLSHLANTKKEKQVSTGLEKFLCANR